MEGLLHILQYLGIFVAAYLGVAGLDRKARDEEGELTQWGQRIRSGLLISAIIAVVAQSLQLYSEAKGRAVAQLESERLRTAVDRAMSRIDTFAIGFGSSVPWPDSAQVIINTRLSTGRVGFPDSATESTTPEQRWVIALSDSLQALLDERRPFIRIFRPNRLASRRCPISYVDPVWLPEPDIGVYPSRTGGGTTIGYGDISRSHAPVTPRFVLRSGLMPSIADFRGACVVIVNPVRDPAIIRSGEFWQDSLSSREIELLRTVTYRSVTLIWPTGLEYRGNLIPEVDARSGEHYFWHLIDPELRW